MDIDPTLLIAIGGAVVVWVALLLVAKARGSGDMIEQQKRETTGLLRNAPPPNMRGEIAPDNPRSNVEAVLAVPHIRAAIEAGRKIEAIKLVRESTGMGLKEAKQLVDMAARV